METMEAPTPRHVSRWRLVADEDAAAAERKNGREGGASAQAEAAAAVAPMSLRYLNEFVGSLQCAPALLEHGLFPDAKEITESMGLFNAVRRYLLPAKDAAAQASTNGKPDGIVVVGDGNTPRSAAMFAFRLRGWKCYSVDPAMTKLSSERARGWASIGNLVVVRNKIENVRISLRRAVVVLVHAHVTLEQALGAVDAEQLAGVVTLPCCNWYSRQEQLLGRRPDLVYDDFSILSDHREIRLWLGEAQSKALDAQASDLAGSMAGMMKGCVRKEFHPDASVGTAPDALADDGSLRSSVRRASADGVAFLGKILDDVTRPAGSEAERQQHLSESDAALDAIATHVPKDASVLVLDCQPNLSWTRAMLQRGYTNVFRLKKQQPGGADDSQAPRQVGMEMSLELVKLQPTDSTPEEAESCRTIRMSSQPTAVADRPDSSDERGQSVAVSIDSTSSSPDRPSSLTHVVDAGFLYRGFRAQPKNALLFRSVCQVLQLLVQECSPDDDDLSEALALVSVTGSKKWRKQQFLGHPKLGYAVSSTVLNSAAPASRPVVVFHCVKRSVGLVKSPQLAPSEAHEAPLRDRVLALKRSLESAFVSMSRSLELTGELDARSITAADAIAKIADAVSKEGAAATHRHFVVTGEVARIHRFSHGVTFVSLVDAGTEETHDAGAHDPGLQVFIHPEVLEKASSSVTHDNLVPLFRRGDQVTVVGFARKSDRGRQMLALLAVKFEAGGEFEAF